MTPTNLQYYSNKVYPVKVTSLIMKHDLPCERFALLKAYNIVRSYLVKGFQHPVRSVPGKRNLTYNEVRTLLKNLQHPIKTTLLKDITDSLVRIFQQ